MYSLWLHALEVLTKCVIDSPILGQKNRSLACPMVRLMLMCPPPHPARLELSPPRVFCTKKGGKTNAFAASVCSGYFGFLFLNEKSLLGAESLLSALIQDIRLFWPTAGECPSGKNRTEKIVLL